MRKVDLFSHICIVKAYTMDIKYNSFFSLFLIFLFSFIAVSCSEQEEPQLAPIDTSLVKIKANIESTPTSQWLIPTKQLSIKVSDVEMTAPQGVILQSISLIANDGTTSEVVDNKPYSGKDLEFRVSLNNLRGRINFSLKGSLVKKDCRDAEILIADNIERIIFSEMPKFECQGRLIVTVHSQSTTGEEYSNFFEVTSSDQFTIQVPREKLYWQPSAGTAPTIDITLGSGASAWSPNSTFKHEITKTAIGNSTGDTPTAKFTIPNTPGSLDALKLQLYVITSYYGTWENITIAPYSITNVFAVTEI